MTKRAKVDPNNPTHGYVMRHRGCRGVIGVAVDLGDRDTRKWVADGAVDGHDIERVLAPDARAAAGDTWCKCSEVVGV